MYRTNEHTTYRYITYIHTYIHTYTSYIHTYLYVYPYIYKMIAQFEQIKLISVTQIDYKPWYSLASDTSNDMSTQKKEYVKHNNVHRFPVVSSPIRLERQIAGGDLVQGHSQAPEVNSGRELLLMRSVHQSNSVDVRMLQDNVTFMRTWQDIPCKRNIM